MSGGSRRCIGLAMVIVAALAARSQTASEPVELRLVVDRQVYAEQEPIFAEWTLTNTNTTALRLCAAIELGSFTRLSCVDSKGVPLEGLGEMVDMFAPPPATPFPPGTSIKVWLDLRREFEVGLGEFTVLAVADTAQLRGQNGIWLGHAKSNAVRFSVKPVEDEEDKKALQLVKIAAGKASVMGARNLFFGRRGLVQAIVSLTNSRRYIPVAHFYTGYKQVQWLELPGGGMITDQRMAEATNGFLDAISMTDSHYLKGLARYYLLRCEALKPEEFPLEDAEKMVAEIQKDHPGTYAAWKAPEVLEKLKAAKKKPDAK